MNWQAISFDWNQVRAFLATAEEGSLSAAARSLGLTQPTLSRQITALEEALGVTLFERGHRTTTPTAVGFELLDYARSFADAAGRMSLAASGQSQAVEGKVSITSTSTMATFYLPRILKRLREEAPGIVVQVNTSNELRDLTRREADIAIRHARPEQPDLIGKLIRETTAHLYASKSFLDAHGRPATPAELSTTDFIGFDPPERFLAALNELGLSLTMENFKLITASGNVLIEFLRQGLGVSALTKDMADRYPELEMALPSLPPFPVPLWLVTHRELNTSRRIRIVFDILAEELAKA